jgi:hypothetical protein
MSSWNDYENLLQDAKSRKALEIAKSQERRNKIGRFLIGDPGKKFLDELKHQFYDQNIFNKGLEDWEPPYREGQRSVYMYLLSCLMSEENSND